MKNTAAIAYSYVRFSSPEQGKGDSRRRQEQLRDEWLAKSGAILDTSLTLRDEGVSAFTGAHRQNPDRNALAAFLALVQSGRIARGSYLIVESLDRLSREHIRPALTLLLNLIEGGIKVVQLLPVAAVFDEDVEPMSLMMAIMELSRGNSESKMKSERVGSAWASKKNEMTRQGKPITRRVPLWLRVEGGSVHPKFRKSDEADPYFVVDEDRAAIIRRMHRMAVEGMGLTAITRRLNQEGVLPFGASKRWAQSSVFKLLTNRALLGEYQPHTIRHRKQGEVARRPEGQPVADYYPRILTDDQFHATQAALTARKSYSGRAARWRVNLFAGIIHDAVNGGSLHCIDKGKKGGSPTYTPERGITGQRTSFPIASLEEAILATLKEIDPATILPDGTDATARVLAREGKLAKTESRIAELKRLLTDDDDKLASLVESLRTLETRREREAVELAEAQREASSPLSSAWADCRTLLSVVKTAEDQEAVRLRLRAAIRRITEGVYVVIVPRASKRLAGVQMHFAGGLRRGFIVLHTPARGGWMESSRASWRVSSSLAKITGRRQLDLRQPAHAAGLVELLAEVDLDELFPEDAD